MISRGRLLAAFLAVFCALAYPATSAAAPRSFESRFELAVGHGRHLAVSGRGDSVTIEVGSPQSLHLGSLPDDFSSFSLTAYVARGTVTRNRIAASFGKFGSIDVRFRPIGKAVALPAKDHCFGANHFTVQRGVFVGGIRFEGEHHYAVLHAHRAAGRVRSPVSLHCFSRHARASTKGRTQTAAPYGRPVVPVPAGHPRGFLAASSRQATNATELYVEHVRRRVFTTAFTEQSLGQMGEFHLAVAASGPRVFTIDNALTRASLTPPAPFHGVGTYAAAADGTKSWTGSLSISFPGAPRWPLAGEQFKVSLSAGI